ncbi:type IV pilus-associated protein [Paucimonas lemoignei]|nr:type IV pilus-associated protein [Paucimonas lemoignei]
MGLVELLFRTLRRLAKYLYGALFALYITAPAYAFTPAPAPLLNSSVVPPNVVLQISNSLNMYNIITSASFDASVTNRISVRYSAACVSALGIVIPCLTPTTVAGTNTVSVRELSALSVLGLSVNCLVGGVPIYKGIFQYCMKLPDPEGNGLTRYTGDYLSWLVDTYGAGGGLIDLTQGQIPNDYRMGAAKSAATTAIDRNPDLRIGLATYNNAASAAAGPGGRIVSNVLDLKKVDKNRYQTTEVTQDQATINANILKTAIAGLVPSANSPVAGTYYEVTRYFRGLKPFYNTTPTRYTSPIQYRCQKNYGVVITDGLPTFDRVFPTGSADADVTNSGRSLPNWDLNAANDGTNINGDAEGNTLFLDDMAKFAFDIDMRKATDGTDLALKSWDDTSFAQQNMNTYTLGFIAGNQMMIDAADASHGRGRYYPSSDRASLTGSLQRVLSEIAALYAKNGTGPTVFSGLGGGAANSSTLTTGARFYQSFYDTSDWRGAISAFDIDPNTGALSTAKWSTDTTVVAGATAPIFESWSTGTTPAKITLNYSNFAAAQQTTLNSGLPTGVTGAQLIAWTMGIANPALRARTRLLGDIVSSPLIAVNPTDKTSADIAGNTSYSTFLTAKAAGMTPSVLVNANDGFFNVLNADGTRRYAYMPSTALPALATIATPGYGTGIHKFTVDGPLAVFDAQQGTSWRTIAFGGVGAGGKAYFAVKLYESNNTPVALWEVKAPDENTPANPFNNLGYAYSKPEVARMADGTSIVVLGNGYDSFTKRASLFVLNANTGALIREIQTPLLDGGDNGLSSVKLKVNSQNVVQAAYAGDLKGRLWKFDMSSTAATGWGVAFGGNTPLFTTPGGAAQPITAQPLVVDHPVNGKLVYVGTGKFMETSDKTSIAQQGFFAIWDADAGAGGIRNTDLVAQSIDSGSVTGLNGNAYYSSSSNDVDWTAKRGWYILLATDDPFLGERVIFPAQVTRGRITFTTAAANSQDPCASAGTGTGRLFELDAAKGGMLNYQVLDTTGDSKITAADSKVSAVAFLDGIPTYFPILTGVGTNPDVKYSVRTSTNVSPTLEAGAAGGSQRVMWRQIQ